MKRPKALSQAFYARPARTVARDLLGKLLVSQDRGRRISGIIVETEAYCDSDEPDLACHGARNRGRPTPRTEVMFGPAGYAYVYFTYGMHWMFNIVTGEPGQANAVLLRALQPVEGMELMAERRYRDHAELTNGPAKLSQALGIDKSLNGAYLCSADSVIWLEVGIEVDSDAIASGPRIGLGKTPEPWKSISWRYWLQGNAWVSR